MICGALEPTIASTKVLLGSSLSVQFWKGHWTDDGCFFNTALASFATNINCTVASQFTQNTWAINLHPVLSNQAQTELNLLMNTLATIQPYADAPDTRSRLQSLNGITTAAFYRLLTFRSISGKPADFIWLKAIPNTCRIFLWLAFKDRFLQQQQNTQKVVV
ncbi:hypothetical protein OsJ_31631 [Oryza sativa Japonica Group]|jgi:hypothetical protein|uniref:Reverse transcriptase zinc-binding domain-containing protein n=2 Tax=Oryza sativa subsp. japonica TaxID=39947 RepID=A0A8J8YDL5_ORYSJ|nr:expressed protein [Oryza sativa Japonica Group]EAZ16181.1 hypothetical protein OsJ_31631 [Oryza sativa Japonica Group]